MNDVFISLGKQVFVENCRYKKTLAKQWRQRCSYVNIFDGQSEIMFKGEMRLSYIIRLNERRMLFTACSSSVMRGILPEMTRMLSQYAELMAYEEFGLRFTEEEGYFENGTVFFFTPISREKGLFEENGGQVEEARLCERQALLDVIRFYQLH